MNRFADSRDTDGPETRAPARPASLSAPEPPLDPGSVVGDFEILRSLGGDRSARVYVARQVSLGRQVLLKVSPYRSDDTRTPARLEHEHVVPVYTEEIAAGRRLLAMRHVAGLSLARLLELSADSPRRWSTGRDLLALLDAELGAEATPSAERDREALARLSHARAVCRLVEGLARALDHAHEQRIRHGDIRPANVLVAQEGRALIMDFNAAASTEPPRAAARSLPGTLADTAAYMAPEQLAVLLPHAAGSPRPIDHRSDIYSLGVVFYELLKGEPPFRAVDAADASASSLDEMLAERLLGPPVLDDRELRVSVGLENILSKCLATDPERRYQTAGQLAIDLDRYLADRRLAFAPDPSKRERVAKWARRHPLLAAGVVVALAAVLVAGARRGWLEWMRVREAEGLIAEAQQSVDRGDAAGATALLAEAERLLDDDIDVLFFLGLEQRRKAAIGQARVSASQAAVMELLRFARLRDAARAYALPAADRRPRAAARAVDEALTVYNVLTDDDWRGQPSLQSLDDRSRGQVEADVTELIAMCVRDALDDPTQADSAAGRRQFARDLLDRIPAEHNEWHAIRELRRAADSRSTEPPDPPPEQWAEFDRYLTGVAARRHAEYAEANKHFADVVAQCSHDRCPRRLWAQFYLAEDLTKRGLVDQAIAGYETCIQLEWNFPWAYHNLGLIYTERKQFARAIEHLEKALQFDWGLASAHAALGDALAASGRHAEAIESFTRAIEFGYDEAAALARRAAARLAIGELAGARDDCTRALDLDPDCQLARECLARLPGPK